MGNSGRVHVRTVGSRFARRRGSGEFITNPLQIDLTIPVDLLAAAENLSRPHTPRICPSAMERYHLDDRPRPEGSLLAQGGSDA